MEGSQFSVQLQGRHIAGADHSAHLPGGDLLQQEWGEFAKDQGVLRENPVVKETFFISFQKHVVLLSPGEKAGDGGVVVLQQGFHGAHGYGAAAYALGFSGPRALEEEVGDAGLLRYILQGKTGGGDWLPQDAVHLGPAQDVQGLSLCLQTVFADRVDHPVAHGLGLGHDPLAGLPGLGAQEHSDQGGFGRDGGDGGVGAVAVLPRQSQDALPGLGADPLILLIHHF